MLTNIYSVHTQSCIPAGLNGTKDVRLLNSFLLLFLYIEKRSGNRVSNANGIIFVQNFVFEQRLIEEVLQSIVYCIFCFRVEDAVFCNVA